MYTCVLFVTVVSKSVVLSRVDICVKVFAREMCSREIIFASGLFLLAKHSLVHVLRSGLHSFAAIL